MNLDLPVVVAVSGASGSVYALRLLHVLLQQNRTVHLVVSRAGHQVLHQETGRTFPERGGEQEWKTHLISIFSEQTGTTEAGTAEAGMAEAETAEAPPTLPLTGTLRIFDLYDFSASAASGSSLTAGMVICPCSTGTLAAVATGNSQNLIHRAAEVHLKERRTLVLVPRETPVSRVALTNMLAASDAGAVVLPAAPGFYCRPRTILDLVDFLVARICDQLQIDHDLAPRWGSDAAD